MRKRRHKRYKDIAPEEIFLDAYNLPKLDTHQFEGRLERPISRRSMWLLLGGFLIIALIFMGRLWMLQVAQGDEYLVQSEENRLHKDILFAKRGGVFDRRGREVISNIVGGDRTDILRRQYATTTGLAHVLGYVTYPQKDKAGFYFTEEIEGKDGVELFYNEQLNGSNGSRIQETDALGEIVSESVIAPPRDGEELQLSVDAALQEKLYTTMATLAEDVGFVGGGSVLMDVRNGEILALTSFPEFDSQVLTDGEDDALIERFVTHPNDPFLNRVISGLYAPGSIIKPFVAVGALERGVITPEKEIYSSGRLVVPNPFNPSQPTIFNDWKAHGNVDLRDALAVSSNVYFFEVGGGFEEQQGIGISGIEEFVRRFGIGEQTGIDLPGETRGVVPNPDWKERHFPGDPWRVGDTYNTSIGQYGFQVTPIQMVRAVAAIANDGLLVRPHVTLDPNAVPVGAVEVGEETLTVVREGMRQAVLEGTAQGLNIPNAAIAAKTGTAELGSAKKNVNSWAVGFFPYENPRYAFATVMERGPATNLIGSVFVMRQLFDWMRINTPEYLGLPN